MLQKYSKYRCAFGSSIAEMSFSKDTGNKYRYSFNGMEKDVESFKDAYDFGARIYDGRFGRWLALDAKQGKYPSYSPYNFCANNPMLFVDPDGNELRFFISLVGPNNPEQFTQFKNIIENRFNNLITISYETVPFMFNTGEFEKEKNGKDFKYESKDGKLYRIPILEVQNYKKVVMSINEEAIKSKAIANLSVNATPDAIEAEMNCIRNELISGTTYSNLNNMITSPIASSYFFNKQEFGGFGGAGGQALCMDNISYYDNVPQIGAFSILYHEIVEGYTYFENAKKTNRTENMLQYPFCHLSALKAQCKDLGILYMSNAQVGDFGHDIFVYGGSVEVYIYTQGKNNTITKTTYSCNVENGQLVPDSQNGKTFSTSSTTISQVQFNKEKTEYEKKSER